MDSGVPEKRTPIPYPGNRERFNWLARHCVCGKEIRSKYPLCQTCRKEYGDARKSWPEWVWVLVKDEQKKADWRRNHFVKQVPYVDDVYTDDFYMAGGERESTPGGQEVARSRSNLLVRCDELGRHPSPPDCIVDTTFYNKSFKFHGLENRIELQQAIKQLFSILTEQEKNAVTLSAQGYTQAEIGKALKISHQAVSKILKKVVAKSVSISNIYIEG